MNIHRQVDHKYLVHLLRVTLRLIRFPSRLFYLHNFFLKKFLSHEAALIVEFIAICVQGDYNLAAVKDS